MSFWEYQPYVPVAQRRADAAKHVKKLLKAGKTVSPVVIEGRRIAVSFWGKAWCDNLEHYSDYENRLPRGRTYVRNGSVIDLSIVKGKAEALVNGSWIYEVRIIVAPVPAERWRAICTDCSGSIGSAVELLQGKLSKQVMERVCRQGDGLFPASREITMSCSCSDGARICKHVAAVLYGIGARFDTDPDALFTLRGVNRDELIAIGVDPSITKVAADSERIIADDDIAALFGLDLEAPALPPVAVPDAEVAHVKPARRKSGKAVAPKPGDEPQGEPRDEKKRRKQDAGKPARRVTGKSPKEPGSRPVVAPAPAAPTSSGEGRPAARTVSVKAGDGASRAGRVPVRLSERKKLAESSPTGRRGKRR